MTGLGAFEEHLPYQKYQGPAIVVRCIIIKQRATEAFKDGFFSESVFRFSNLQISKKINS